MITSLISLLLLSFRKRMPQRATTERTGGQHEGKAESRGKVQQLEESGSCQPWRAARTNLEYLLAVFAAYSLQLQLSELPAASSLLWNTLTSLPQRPQILTLPVHFLREGMVSFIQCSLSCLTWGWRPRIPWSDFAWRKGCEKFRSALTGRLNQSWPQIYCPIYVCRQKHGHLLHTHLNPIFKQ